MSLAKPGGKEEKMVVCASIVVPYWPENTHNYFEDIFESVIQPSFTKDRWVWRRK